MAKINVEDVKKRLQNNINKGTFSTSNQPDEAGSQVFEIEFIKQLNNNLFVFKKTDSDGIVSYILSPADDYLNPILGEFDEMPDDDSIPPCMQDWLNSYSEEIDYFQENENDLIENENELMGANELIFNSLNLTDIKLIDLGLTSGTKWADKNLGAELPEDSGDFYAWGELEFKDQFSWNNYKWNDSEGTKYKSKDLGNDISKNILYDPAYSKNKLFCLPTANQWQELIDECTWTFKQIKGKNVYEVKGPNGNSIIISLAGYKNSGTALVKGNTYGCYMTSSIYSSNTSPYSKTADFTQTKISITTSRKMIGRSVRVVNSNEEIIEDNKPSSNLVDLGLSVRWSNLNLGAENPEDSGDYFAWGETESKNSFSWNNYKWDDSEGTKYKSKDLGNDISKNILYDPAYLKNKSLCLPTAEQWLELINKCTWTFKQIKGKNVYEVKGPNGNSIILSASGYISSSAIVKGNTYGCYMTSSIYGSNTNYVSKTFDFTDSKKVITTSRKMIGRTVRPVESGEIEDVETKPSIKLIDLGLSVDWADMNIGSENPEDFGNYYAWGELETKDTYTWNNYKYYDKINSTSSNYKTLDIGSNISQTQYDKAYSINNNLCLPTAEQWQELINKCSIAETTLNNVKGFKFIGPNGNSIFLPLSGYMLEKSSQVNLGGYYMTGSIYSSNVNQYAKIFELTTKKDPAVKYLRKRAGITIRPVSVKQNDLTKYRRTINALVPYKWGQGSPWNNDLPKDPANGNTVITGCVNTSMAQILAYYGCIGIKGNIYKRSVPETEEFVTNPGTKSQQIMPAITESLNIDYDSINYNKASDFKKGTKQYEMIGKLMKQLGCMNKSTYTSTNTLASNNRACTNYKNKLNLGPNVQLIYANTIGIEKFKQIIYEELEQGYPVNMGGFNKSGGGGHAFICDGYRTSDEKFHFNWGWNGNYDGWFNMEVLNVCSQYDLSYFKIANVNLHPKNN